MAEFAGQAVAPAQQPAFQDDTGRQPCADADVGQVLLSSRIVETIDAQGGHAHIVVDHAGNAEAGDQPVDQRVVVPVQVDGDAHNAAERVLLSWNSKSDGRQRAAGVCVQCQRLLDRRYNAEQRGVGAESFTSAGDEFDIERLGLTHRLPAKLDRLVAFAHPLLANFLRRSTIAAEQNGRVRLDR